MKQGKQFFFFPHLCFATWQARTDPLWASVRLSAPNAERHWQPDSLADDWNPPPSSFACRGGERERREEDTESEGKGRGGNALALKVRE